MEYLVRSLAGTHGYIQFEHGQESDMARCAVFQAICPECEKPIPAEGPSVTFRTPTANPGEAVTYLTTVHLGCALVLAGRIESSRAAQARQAALAIACDGCGAEPDEPCNPDVTHPEPEET